MFVLKSNAELVYTKRFDFNPRCFHVYQRGKQNRNQLCIAVAEHFSIVHKVKVRIFSKGMHKINGCIWRNHTRDLRN